MTTQPSTELSIDFETGSQCDLLTHGSYRYATDLSTEVYMLGWAFDDEPAEIWTPDQPFPERVIDHVEAGGPLLAWNATFERLIWMYVLANDHDLPVPKLEQYRCTMARAKAHGLPGKLGDAARAMQVGTYKQTDGLRLIKAYSAMGVRWADIPEEEQALFTEYCKQDVEVERAIGQCLRPLTAHEWSEYHLNERTNDRGIPLDLKMAAAALDYAEDVRAEVDGKINVLTGGEVETARQRTARDAWLLPQLTEEQTKLLHVYKNGEQKISFDQAHRDALAVHPDLPAEVAVYLQLADEAGGATISKYAAMLNREVDGRYNGALMFNGAGQTGRFSSTGIQFHNLRRDSFDDPEPIIQDLVEGYELPDVTTTLARLVRSTIYRPQGLSWYDWSSIEGRVAPWLQGGELGERKLQLYRDGVDPYVYNASETYRIPMTEVDKAQRQAGKVQELALQFLGGIGALKVMGRNYGLYLDDHEAARLRDGWRKANPWAQSFGGDLDRAALLAVRNPGEWYKAGRVRYAYNGAEWLFCELPSGRYLAYYQPRREMVTTPWGDERPAVTCLWGASKPKKGEEWPRRAMHGGIWIENITQATAADLLRAAILRVEAAGLPIVLHVHDEIITEGYCVEQLGEIMMVQPDWSEGLPLAGEGDSGTRYGK